MPKGATIIVNTICAEHMKKRSTPTGRPIVTARLRHSRVGINRPFSCVIFNKGERAQSCHNSTEAAAACAANVPQAAPSTPNPAPHTENVRPNTVTSRTGKIKNQLNTTSIKQSATFITEGVFMSPADRSIPPARNKRIMKGCPNAKMPKYADASGHTSGAAPSHTGT